MIELSKIELWTMDQLYMVVKVIRCGSKYLGTSMWGTKVSSLLTKEPLSLGIQLQTSIIAAK